MKKTALSIAAAAAFIASSHAEVVKLDTIEVTAASKTKQSLENVTSTVSVITAEEIETLHPSTVGELLNRLPGVNMNQSGGLGTTQNLFLRGMSNERVLVLIDGVRYYDPANISGVSFTHLVVSDIEQIEVIRGAQSGVWGSDASAGVINIVTKQARSGTDTQVNVEAGSYQTKKASAVVTHQEGKNSFKLSASRLLSDSFSAQAPYGDDIDQYEDDKYRNTTVGLSAKHAFNENTSAEVIYHDINSYTNYDAYNAPDAVMRSDYRSQLASGVLKHRYEEHALKLRYDHTTYERNFFDASSGVKTFEGKSRNIELSDRYDYVENGFLNLGVQKEYFTANYIEVSSDTGHMQTDTTAIYATNSNRFDALLFTQTIRYDDYSNFDGKVTGKVGIKYNFSDDLSLKSNYGTAYNAPSIVKILNPWGASNLDLKPETTRSFDAGVEYKELAVTLFYNKVEGLMEWYDPDGWAGPLEAYYVNGEGESTFRGVEAEYGRMINDELSFNTNYTYLEAKNEAGQALKQRPKHHANFGVDYYPNDALHLGVNGEYVGTRFNGNNESGRQTGRYTLWNMVANYDFSDTLRGYVKVDNLTDKYYQTVEGYATAERSFYVGLTAEF